MGSEVLTCWHVWNRGQRTVCFLGVDSFLPPCGSWWLNSIRLCCKCLHPLHHLASLCLSFIRWARKWDCWPPLTVFSFAFVVSGFCFLLHHVLFQYSTPQDFSLSWISQHRTQWKWSLCLGMSERSHCHSFALCQLGHRNQILWSSYSRLGECESLGGAYRSWLSQLVRQLHSYSK